MLLWYQDLFRAIFMTTIMIAKNICNYLLQIQPCVQFSTFRSDWVQEGKFSILSSVHIGYSVRWLYCLLLLNWILCISLKLLLILWSSLVIPKTWQIPLVFSSIFTRLSWCPTLEGALCHSHSVLLLLLLFLPKMHLGCWDLIICIESGSCFTFAYLLTCLMSQFLEALFLYDILN